MLPANLAVIFLPAADPYEIPKGHLGSYRVLQRDKSPPNETNHRGDMVETLYRLWISA